MGKSSDSSLLLKNRNRMWILPEAFTFLHLTNICTVLLHELVASRTSQQYV
jgi:hypothetical protein